MDPFDKNQTDPIWERVLGISLAQETFGRQRPAFPWRDQARAEDEFGKGCLALSRRFSGPRRQTLMGLQRQAASRAECLRRMGREAGELRPGRPQPRGQTPVTLEGLQRQAGHLAQIYENGKDHPVWGPVLTQFQREVLQALRFLQTLRRRP